MIRVCVCGGRDYSERDLINETLDQVHRKFTIWPLMHGSATGADHLADDWAFNNEVPVLLFRPRWAKYGKTAGPRRNQQMIEMGDPQLVIAFPGGRGTESLISIAEKFSVAVRRVGDWRKGADHG